MGRDREGREIKNGERHRARKGREIKGGLIVRYELMGHGISGRGSRESGKKWSKDIMCGSRNFL